VREEDPEAYSRAQTWLCVADFVAQRLSGEKAMDYSLASRTGLFDIDRREWSERLLEAAGIDRSLMPRLAPSGSPVGLVDRMASQLTGLPIGTPVFTGGHDHICGALAVGVTDEGAVLDSTGTAEAVLMVLKGPNTSRALCEAGFSVGCHTARDRYYLLGSLSTSGAVIEWLKDHLEAAADIDSDPPVKDVYASLMDRAATVPPGSEGLLFLPYLRGSTTVHVDPLARGAFVGLAYNHRQAHLVRAALEGVCYELGAMLDVMRGLTGVTCRELTAIGGATRNDLWMGMKADVTGKAISAPALEEATTFGAALLAGLGAGVYLDEDDIRRAVELRRNVIHPDEERHRIYQGCRRVYARLYPACKEVFQAIAEESCSPDSLSSAPAGPEDSAGR
jgi:xylulokinase